MRKTCILVHESNDEICPIDLFRRFSVAALMISSDESKGNDAGHGALMYQPTFSMIICCS